jgi:hypothetical protein
MLVVAAQDKKKYDLVPSNVFGGVLPSAFVTEFSIGMIIGKM